MTDIKHTEGPWVFRPSYDPRGMSVWGRSVGGCQQVEANHKICDVRGWGHIQYLPDGEKIQDANGRLLAAAPELELLCEEFVLTFATNNPSVEHSVVAKARELLERIRKEPDAPEQPSV